jgi:hypothetical protein
LDPVQAGASGGVLALQRIDTPSPHPADAESPPEEDAGARFGPGLGPGLDSVRAGASGGVVPLQRIDTPGRVLLKPHLLS